MPKKATNGAAAYDLYAPEDVEIKLGRQVIDLKFSMELPHGYAATVQPRSGFSAKGFEASVCDAYFEGAELHDERLNADVLLGLIDEDYRGNVGVIVKNKQYHDTMFIKKGTRIAQMRIVEVPETELVEVCELSDTDRGDGGFGSTGTK